MDNVLVIVGLIAIAIIFASLTPPPRIRQRKPVKSVALPPPLPLNVVEEERHIAETVEAAGEEADEASTNEVRAIQDRLAKARDLVSKSGVDSAACDILGMIRYWPSLLETNNGQPPLPVGPLDEGRMPAQRHGAREGKWVGWSWNRIPYRLELSDSANNRSAFDDDLDTGDLRLWVDGELVMHLDVLKRVGVQYDRWTAFGVSVLRPGSWMLRLNELAARLRIADEPYGEKAKNIELYKCNTAADGKGNE